MGSTPFKAAFAKAGFSHIRTQKSAGMYALLLAAHSWFRWLVQVSLVYALYRAYRGWLGDKAFSRLDNTLRHTTATIAHVQLVLGLWLYFVSPVIDHFLHDFGEAIHDRQLRFFGMEHSTMMFIAVAFITLGSSLAKRKPTDKQKFRTMATWFSIALLIILTSVPWPFSPFTARPWFRGIVR